VVTIQERTAVLRPNNTDAEPSLLCNTDLYHTVMKPYKPVKPPVALTIAGSDSGGGAGIQADLKTMEAHGVFGTSVLTAVTAQNSNGVHSSHVLPTEEITAQYEAVTRDFPVGAIKTGMLATTDVVEAVTEAVDTFAGPIVVDPVMIAATGDRLLSERAEKAYDALIEAATVVTPNADEAEVLVGIDVDSVDAAEAAGKKLVTAGADAALIKGGHIEGDDVVDTLVVGDGTDSTVVQFSHERVDTNATHGSGCTLSSAIAARLAHGIGLEAAVEQSVSYMQRAVQYGIDVGNGPGAVHHMIDARTKAAYGTVQPESVSSAEICLPPDTQ